MSDDDRQDLAALSAELARRLAGAELPLLAVYELTMWEYIALSRLRRGEAATQRELAKAIRYDRTRLIALLDGLEAKGLVVRSVDPTDRRARIVRATTCGRRRHAAAQAAIWKMEDRLLTDLTGGERRVFRSVLERLACGSR